MAKTVKYYIDIDASGSVKGGEVARKSLQNIDNATERTGISTIAMGNIFADVASQMMNKLADLPSQIFEIGTRTEETASKYNTVFGPSVEYVNTFLDDFAVKAGLSNSAAQELTSRAGAIGQGFGYTQEESAKLSTQIATLAGDLTSFNNVPIEQSSNAIITALSGEREALKTLGIVVSENDVQKQALTQTGKESADQLTQEEKAAATLSLIYDRAGVAVGDLERTQDSAANTARRVEASLQNVAEELSTQFLPIMAEGLQFVEEILSSEQFDDFMAGTKSAIDNIIIGIDFLATNTDAGIEAIWSTWEWLKDNIATLFINLVTVAKNYVLNLPEIFWNGIQAIFKIFQALEDYSKETLQNILSGFVELGKAIFAALTDPLSAKAEIEQAFSNILEIGKAQVANFADLGKDLGTEMRENFEANAELLADGLIEYDNTAFTGVEFTTWADAAKKRAQDALKVDAPTIQTPNVEVGNYDVPRLDIPTPKDVMIDVGEIDLSSITMPNWDEILFIPDGTIDTLNKNLAKIDLMPDSTLQNLQDQLSVVQDLYVNSQSDAERQRLAVVEESIQLQIQAKTEGVDVDRIIAEEYLEEQKETFSNLYNTASDYVNVFSQIRQQEAERQITRIDKETQKRVKAIDVELKKENLSETERAKLIQERQQIEASAEEKKATIKRETFDKEKRANTVMAIAQTALAIIKALPNIPLSIAVGALGALQTAVVASQPNPYLEGGLIEERMPNGLSAPGMKMISINENGSPEYVVNAESTKKFQPILDLMNYNPGQAEQLIAELGVQPFLSGGLISESSNSETKAKTVADYLRIERELMELLNRSEISNYSESTTLNEQILSGTLDRFNEVGGLAPVQPSINALSGANFDVPTLETNTITDAIAEAIENGLSNFKANLRLVAEGRELNVASDNAREFETKQTIPFN